MANSLGDTALEVGSPWKTIEGAFINFGIQVKDWMKSRKISYGFKLIINRG